MPTSRGSDLQVISQLVESCAETTRRLKRLESHHRVVALLDRPMILLDLVVQILVVSMQDLASDYPPNCLGIGRGFISRHPEWFLTRTVDKATKKPTSGVFVSVLTQHGIE